jgi:hypothetical protein
MRLFRRNMEEQGIFNNKNFDRFPNGVHPDMLHLLRESYPEKFMFAAPPPKQHLFQQLLQQ